jgi:hypothetical protein
MGNDLSVAAVFRKKPVSTFRPTTMRSSRRRWTRLRYDYISLMIQILKERTADDPELPEQIPRVPLRAPYEWTMGTSGVP